MNGHVSRAALVALATAILLVPGLALAACPTDPGAILNEVAEMGMFKLGANGQRKSRQATATIVGKAREGTPICPVTNPPIAVGGYCTVSVIASDLIRLDTGQGTVSGNFYVLGDLDNPDDGDDGILIQGTLRGAIDLSPAPFGFALLKNASLQGRGAKNTVVANQVFRADFEGIFLLPFTRVPGGPAFYLCPGGPLQELTSKQMSLDTPTVQLEITFK
jgi:hypothetical protein